MLMLSNANTIEMRGNVNAKERYERQETTSWVKLKRHEKKRETGSSATKKIQKYWLLGLRTRQAAKNRYLLQFYEILVNHYLGK